MALPKKVIVIENTTELKQLLKKTNLYFNQGYVCYFS